jgi:hypothetical protein
MVYSITGDAMLFAVNRSQIIDISPDDIIEISGLPGARYTWKHHDMEFLENNPDSHIFIRIERIGKNQYEATELLVHESEKHV